MKSLALINMNNPFITPKRIVPPYNWVEHIPFAFFITQLIKPGLFVELGVHTGNSYNAFCQIVDENGLNTRCYGVDTWKGEEHSGYYYDEIYNDLSNYQNEQYNHFSKLLRMKFDDALGSFNDGTIDLLHIDGCHRYEAIKHDFENWLPKMSNKGVILLHDTAERGRNFGVWKLWEEISGKYNSSNFEHGHGLGILLVGKDQSQDILTFINDLNRESFLKNFYYTLGNRYTESQQNIRYKQENASLIQQLQCSKNHFVTQLYIDTGAGFNTRQLITNPISELATVINFELFDYQGIKQLRFDLINCTSIIELKKITIIDNNSFEIPVTQYTTNETFSQNQTLFFEHDDPQIIIKLPDNKLITNIIFNFKILAIKNDSLRRILSVKNNQIAILSKEIYALKITERDKKNTDSFDHNNTCYFSELYVNKFNNDYEDFINRVEITDRVMDIAFEVPAQEKISRMRFKPINTYTNIIIKNIIIIDDNDNHIHNFTLESNTKYVTENSYIFDTNAPHILIIFAEPIIVREIIFSLEYMYIDKEMHEQVIRLISNDNKKLLSKCENLSLANTTIQKKMEEFKEKQHNNKEAVVTLEKLGNVIQAKDRIIKNLNHQLHTKLSELHNIKTSLIWKSTFPLRFLKKTLKLYKIYLKIKKYLNKIYKLLFRLTEDDFRYLIFMRQNKITKQQLLQQKNHQFTHTPLISILTPTYNTPPNFLMDMIQSVINQTYTNWELCIADGGSKKANTKHVLKSFSKKDKRIKINFMEENLGISLNTNEALKSANGEYIMLLDHDDLLTPDALFEVVKVINADQNVDFIYSDEDKLSHNGKKRFMPHFKPDWSPDTLRSYNYPIHISVFSKRIIEKTGFFRKEFDGSQDYDLILRVTENTRNIVHIPKVLYNWRVHNQSTASDANNKNYALIAAKKALEAHLKRQGLKGNILDNEVISTYKIEYELNDNPLISIIIPNKDHINDLNTCISSIQKKSRYRNFEIIIVENNSIEKKIFEYYDQIREQNSNIRLVYWDKSFNYSAINNYAVKYAKGDVILFLNNDVEVINNDWLERMLEYIQRNDVGAVGAKLYYPDNTLQHAGVIVGLGGVAGHSHKYFPASNPGYFARLKIVQNMGAVTGACLMTKKDIFEQIGGFDEELEIAFNDVDLCMKIRNAGYLIVWTPFVELYHYESKSRGTDDTPDKIIRFQNEIIKFKQKWQKDLLAGDPYYNKNLTLDREDFSIHLR